MIPADRVKALSGTGVVRTVLGDIDPQQLGTTDYHEHLFQNSPLLPGDVLADEVRSRVEAASLMSAGVGAMIEATPTGLGRDVQAVARISTATGLAVVHATGAHHSGHYAPDHFLRAASTEKLRDRFVRDILVGFDLDDGAPARGADGFAIRAGIVKAGVRYWSIGEFEIKILDAAAATSRATTAAVMVHLDYGSAAHEVLDRLDSEGVESNRVVLAHMDRNLDSGLHASLIERGCYLGYDGMARHREAPDSAIIECLTRTIETAGAERLLLGGDVARASRYRAYGGLPGLDYLPRRFVPRVVDALGDGITASLLVTNPARLLTLDFAKSTSTTCVPSPRTTRRAH